MAETAIFSEKRLLRKGRTLSLLLATALGLVGLTLLAGLAWGISEDEVMVLGPLGPYDVFILSSTLVAASAGLLAYRELPAPRTTWIAIVVLAVGLGIGGGLIAKVVAAWPEYTEIQLGPNRGYLLAEESTVLGNTRLVLFRRDGIFATEVARAAMPAPSTIADGHYRLQANGDSVELVLFDPNSPSYQQQIDIRGG